jgi:hypothetical protein
MITCHRLHLEDRCRERGYTLDEVLPCVVLQDGDEWTIDVDHPAYPRVSRLPEPPQPSAPLGHGPGTELKKLLASWPFYVTASPDCSCNRVAAEMDAWGPDECEQLENQAYILAALKENAERRGLPYLELAGRMLLKRAIRAARKATAG